MRTDTQTTLHLILAGVFGVGAASTILTVAYGRWLSHATHLSRGAELSAMMEVGTTGLLIIGFLVAALRMRSVEV